MKNAIAILQIALENLATNEPIHRAEGNAEQADIEASTAIEIRAALEVLRTWENQPGIH
tara:strand:+ start:1138 stop:1314 length:177 start_codon:yes stop_codon:yes gene_type:complete